MQAKLEDLDKVIEVSKEQIIGSLKTFPLDLPSFQKGLKTFSQVSESWKESVKSKTYSDLPAIKELEEMMKPDILDLIQRQRLTCMVQGERFFKSRKDNRDRVRYVYCKLSPNHKNFYFGDWNSDKDSPSIEQLTRRIPVSDIKDANFGDAGGPGAGRGHGKNLSISITYGTGETLDIQALDQKTFDYWTDGINILRREDMKSAKFAEQLESLLSLEVKLKLLHLNGIDVPPKIPEIPPLPTNYNFYHQY